MERQEVIKLAISMGLDFQKNAPTKKILGLIELKKDLMNTQITDAGKPVVPRPSLNGKARTVPTPKPVEETPLDRRRKKGLGVQRVGGGILPKHADPDRAFKGVHPITGKIV